MKPQKTPGLDAAASGTQPERRLRQALKEKKMRFEVESRPLAGRRIIADVLFPEQRVAVFIDGCFWHGCPEHGATPRNDVGYWGRRAESARVRDAEIVSALEAESWTAVRVWEHEHVLDAVEAIQQAIDAAIQRAGVV
ncbi:very short patch repair endonuclease [Kineococcus sp. SYSU DK002]|uniref:very short patch repair endonuclease n=1 Tax=Kineococcus sp. SYSU DK002 TaxID=3383123 RepID=UPI003D7CA635